MWFPSEEMEGTIGLTLGLLMDSLDAIAENYSKVEDRFIECIARWLRRADNVDSKGGATFESLSDALQSMNENAAAYKLDQESKLISLIVLVLTVCVYSIEHNIVLAIDIFNTHRPLLSQSLSDPVSVAIMLQREGVITGEALASVASASPSVPNQREVLLAAIIVAIHSKYSLLQTFASVLCKFTGNVKLGTVIQRDYGESITFHIMAMMIIFCFIDQSFNDDKKVIKVVIPDDEMSTDTLSTGTTTPSPTPPNTPTGRYNINNKTVIYFL